MYHIDGTQPSLVINEKTYTGFQSIEDIEKIIPALKFENKKDQKVPVKPEPATAAL